MEHALTKANEAEWHAAILPLGYVELGPLRNRGIAQAGADPWSTYL